MEISDSQSRRLQIEKLRKSGIDIIRYMPWGTHFCQFYQTKEELINILVPYFKAGLENNEFCMWITSEPLSEVEAKIALQKAIPELDSYLEHGQIDIIPYTEWYTQGGIFDSGKVLKGLIDKLNNALKIGFDGLRLSGNTFWLEKESWNDFVDYEEAINSVIGQYRVLYLCTYSLDKFTAAEIINVVNNHEFALNKHYGKWDLIETLGHEHAGEALKESEILFKQFFDNHLNGFALYEMVSNEKGEPVDFIYLEANKAFEDLTGLKKEDLINKKVTEILPPVEVAELIKVYSNVALTGEPTVFQYFSPFLDKYYEVIAFSPQKRRFITFFAGIEKADENLKQSSENLEEQVKIRTAELMEANE